MAALDVGYDIKVSGVILDRFCGGGITAVALAAGQIISGMEDLIVAEGTEMMFYTATAMAQDVASGHQPLGMGAGNARLAARHPQSHQGVCADAIATMDGITRAELDAFGLESQRRAARAIAGGRFDRSLVPVDDDDGTIVLARDEHPRPETTLESLAALRPAFADLADRPLDARGTSYRTQIGRRYPDLDIGHVHHAGTTSGVVDGAAALLLASKAYVDAKGWCLGRVWWRPRTWAAIRR